MLVGRDTPIGADVVERAGIPRALLWGYVGVFLFMIGDGVESNYLAPYMQHIGFSAGQAATLITVYGAPVAVGSWLAGTLTAFWGPKRVMYLGAAWWVVFEILFLSIGLRSKTYPLIMLTYGLRGAGYPLFAFPFLFWITRVAEVERRSLAVGWFWVGFTGGLPTLGALFASGTIPAVGEYTTFWLSLGIVATGALIALLGLRTGQGAKPTKPRERPIREQFLEGIDVSWKKPKVGRLGIVRVINTTPQYAFFVFLPTFFTNRVGVSQTQYLRLVSLTYAANMVASIFFGRLADRVGWRKTIVWCGAVGCAIASPILYFGPLAAGPNFLLCALCVMTFGFMLSGFTAIPPLMSILVGDEDQSAAFAIYALAAGVSAFTGAGIVALLRPVIGTAGLIWVFVGLYLIAAVIASRLHAEQDPGEKAAAPAARSASAHGQISTTVTS